MCLATLRARLGDNLSKWETGQWEFTDACYKLEVRDTLEAIEDVEDASENRRIIKGGSRCVFLGLFLDGDAVIKCRNRRHIVFVQDLDGFTLV